VSGRAQSTAPLVTLHGFTGHAGAWDAVAPPPATHLSLAGHAPDVPVPVGWTFDREVDRVAGELGRGPVHLAGYSMGGRVALAVAVRFPERIARLSLVAVHPGLDDAAEAADRRAADERWCALLESRGIEAFVAAWEDQPMWRSQSSLAAETRARQRRTRLAHSAPALAGALRRFGLGAMPSLWRRLASLSMPVDWVAGSLDGKYAELAHRAASATPTARVMIIDGAGHNVLLERPAELSGILVASGERPAP
jgi:2-succinyl-6-hydroxy-2,4-cyclohexadiene-1-carboxylate synthase